MGHTSEPARRSSFTRAELKSFTAFGSPRAVLGRQPADLNGAQVWVVPNPSGRNAHASADTLAAAYREVALAAAIDLTAR